MLVTIVIPYLNRAAFLEKTLATVQRQTHRPLQAVLVDNGSQDASPEICKRFCEQYNAEDFEVLLLKEEKAGAASARNKGLAAAKGEYVYFFDSDDEMSPDFIADAVAKARACAMPDIVAAHTVVTFPDGGKRPRRILRSASVPAQILTATYSTQSLFLSTDFMKNAGGWDGNVFRWDDWELGVRLLTLHPKIVWLEKKKYHRIYQHPDSITGKSISENLSRTRPALEAVARLVAGDAASRAALRGQKLAIAGEIWREGNRRQADALAAEAFQEATACQRFFLKLFYAYSKHVGKAARRLFLWTLWLYR